MILACPSQPAQAQLEHKFAFCESAPWASTREAACGIAAQTLPMCDRPGVTHYNIQSQLLSPTACMVSWQFTEAGETQLRDWSEFAPYWSRANVPELEGDACTSGASVGNPILPPTAEKYQPETDYIDAAPGGLNFSRTYRSNRGLDTTRASGPLGKTWTHNHSFALTVAV
ncbi:MAG: hypothetical protein KJ901_10585, partial [Gammaproteobacteria bacterium]|nr:hypothetical protein [Gammaproteobacteria bacterium]